MPTRSLAVADGVSLHLLELGPADAPPVVVLHGGPAAHHEYLLPAFARLAEDRRLVLYDQRGGGRSPVAAGVEVGFAAQLADLAAVMDDVGARDLVGYSFGGLIAMMFAARNPARVGKLALVSSAPPHHGYRDALDRAMADAQRSPWVVAERAALERSELKQELPQEYRRRRFGLAVAGYFADPRLCHGLTPFLVSSRTADAIRDDLGDYDFRGELAQLPGERTLFLHGEDDPIAIAHAEEAARLGGARIERLPRCGHVPYLEAPETFFSILRAFLGDST